MTTETFNLTGSEQTWVVPAGVSEVTLKVWGAQGGSVNVATPGGLGGYAEGKLAVTPGETLRIYVGGAGGSTSAGGGGATDIRQGGTALADRVIVAGGGGGGGDTAPGVDNPGAGGDGGGSTGDAGNSIQMNGQGGTQATGGASGGGSATAGTLGNGGNGAASSSAGGYNGGGSSSTSDYAFAAGGGGYYGGGGATGTSATRGGGGGGSGYVGGVTDSSMLNGQRAGDGYAEITYGPAAVNVSVTAVPMTATAAMPEPTESTTTGDVSVGTTPATAAGLMVMPDWEPRTPYVIADAALRLNEIRYATSTSVDMLGDNKKGLFRFPVIDVSGGVASATMSFWARISTIYTTGGVLYSQSIDEDWAEVDYSPAPAIGAVSGTGTVYVAPTGSLVKYTIDVTEVVQSWGADNQYGIALVSDSGPAPVIAAKEYPDGYGVTGATLNVEVIGSVSEQADPATATGAFPIPVVGVSFLPDWTVNASPWEATAAVVEPSVTAVMNTSYTLASPMTAAALSLAPSFTNDTDVQINAGIMGALAGGPYTDYSEADDPYVQFVNNNLRYDYWLPLNDPEGSLAPEHRFTGTPEKRDFPTEYINDPDVGLRDEDLLGRKYVRLDGGLGQGFQYPAYTFNIGTSFEPGGVYHWSPSESNRSEKANTYSFVIRTTARDTQLGGNVSIKDGRIHMFSDYITANSTHANAYVGRKFVSDGEWHHVVIHKNIDWEAPSGHSDSFWMMVDGEIDIYRGANIFGGVGQVAPPVFYPWMNGIKPDAGATVDVADYWFATQSSINYNGGSSSPIDLNWDGNERPDHFLRAMYYTWINTNAVHAAPFLADADMPLHKGRGNRKRALVLYFNAFNNPTLHNFDEYGHFHFSRIQNGTEWGEFYVDIKPAQGYNNLMDWSARYIDLRNDVDLDAYDLVIWRDGPIRAQLNHEQRSRMDDMAVQAVEATSDRAIPMLMFHPDLVIAFDLVDQYAYERYGHDAAGSQYAESMVRDGSTPPIANELREGTEATNNDFRASRLVKNHWATRMRVLNQAPGFNDLQDNARVSWKNYYTWLGKSEGIISPNAGPGYNLERYGGQSEDGDWFGGRPWVVGDVIRFSSFGLNVGRGNTFDAIRWLWGALPGRHKGTPLVEVDLGSDYLIEPTWGEEEPFVNPVVPIFLVSAGTEILGQQLGAPIIVSHLPAGSDMRVDESLTAVANDEGPEPDGSYKFWSFVTQRDRIVSAIEVNVNEVTGEITTSYSTRVEEAATRDYYPYYGYAQRIHNFVARYADQQEPGTVNVRTGQAAEATAEMPEPTMSAGRQVTIGAEPMLANAKLEAPAEADQSDVTVQTFPMRANAQMVELGKNLGFATMHATATMPNAQPNTTGIGIQMVVSRPLFDMRVRV